MIVGYFAEAYHHVATVRPMVCSRRNGSTGRATP
jgi:hypothetical protein